MKNIYLLYAEGKIIPFCDEHGAMAHNHIEDEYRCSICGKVLSRKGWRRLKLELWGEITREIMGALSEEVRYPIMAS